MIRYTEEQKAAAMQLVGEIGVRNASKELGITVATLYKWKNADQPADETAVKPAKEKKARAPRKSKRAQKAEAAAAAEEAVLPVEPEVVEEAAVEVEETPVVIEETPVETPVVDADVRALLSEDDRDAKISQLEDENARLRVTVARLKKALNALLD